MSQDFEDDISMRHHLMTLQKESAKLSPDLEVISVKMERTASYRKRVYDQDVTLTDTLSEFPALRFRSFVSRHT